MFDTTVLTVRRGDFLRVADGTVDGPGWLVEVLDIRYGLPLPLAGLTQREVDSRVRLNRLSMSREWCD